MLSGVPSYSPPASASTTLVSLDDVAIAVAARIRKQLPKHIAHSNTGVSLPNPLIQGLEEEIATKTLDALQAGWKQMTAADDSEDTEESSATPEF